MDEARTLKQAAFGAQLDPLHLVHPGHGWYTDLDSRLAPDHYGVTTRLGSLFREQLDSGRHLHVGLVGHSGTGKSTMVRRALADLRDIGILPIYINARESFDQADMAFADVVLVLAEAVVRQLVTDANTVAIDPRRLQLMRDWFAEVIFSREHR